VCPGLGASGSPCTPHTLHGSPSFCQCAAENQHTRPLYSCLWGAGDLSCYPVTCVHDSSGLLPTKPWRMLGAIYSLLPLVLVRYTITTDRSTDVQGYCRHPIRGSVSFSPTSWSRIDLGMPTSISPPSLTHQMLETLSGVMLLARRHRTSRRLCVPVHCPEPAQERREQICTCRGSWAYSLRLHKCC
jgi:hypothetical protein